MEHMSGLQMYNKKATVYYSCDFMQYAMKPGNQSLYYGIQNESKMNN